VLYETGADDSRPALHAYPKVLAASKLCVPYYAKYVLGVEPWRVQADILDSFRATVETYVRAANGVGKSFTTAVAMNWFLDCHAAPNESILTAARFRQAWYTFESVKAMRRAALFKLPGIIGATQIVVGPRWHARAFAARDPISIQGPHADHFAAFVDEASGVRDPIFEAIDGMMTTGHVRLLVGGNPNTNHGRFARVFRTHDGPRKFTISAYDTPNLVAGRIVNPSLVTPESVARLIRIYGEDSDVVRVRVYGLPPRQDAKSVIGLGDVDTARTRGERFRGEGMPALELRVDGDRIGALDVAREGDDDCALVEGRGSRLIAITKWRDSKLDVTMAKAVVWLEEGPGFLLIDVSGMGAGVFDVVAPQFPGRVFAVDFGGGAVLGHVRANTETGESTPVYGNRRTEMYYEAAKFLRREAAIDDMTIEKDLVDELEEDLTAPWGGMNEKGVLFMEPKPRTKARVGRSPDVGDAFVMWVAGILGGCDVGARGSTLLTASEQSRGTFVDPHASRRWRRGRDWR
jgi:phage terminase large subunit